MHRQHCRRTTWIWTAQWALDRQSHNSDIRVPNEDRNTNDDERRGKGNELNLLDDDLLRLKVNHIAMEVFVKPLLAIQNSSLANHSPI